MLSRKHVFYPYFMRHTHFFHTNIPIITHKYIIISVLSLNTKFDIMVIPPYK